VSALGSAVGGALSKVDSLTTVVQNAEGVSQTVLKKGVQVALDTSVAVLSSYTTSVATGMISAYDTGSGQMNWDAARENTYSVGTIAGALSAGVKAGVGGAFGLLPETTQDMYAGAIRLATGAADKTAEYLTYAGARALEIAGQGGSDFSSIWKDGFDDMGGITLNVLNIGDIIGVFGGDGTSDIEKKIGGMGLLELHLGSDGATMKLGTGGIDVSPGTIANTLQAGWDYRENIGKGIIAGGKALLDWITPKKAGEVAQIATGVAHNVFGVPVDFDNLNSGLENYFYAANVFEQSEEWRITNEGFSESDNEEKDKSPAFVNPDWKPGNFADRSLFGGPDILNQIDLPEFSALGGTPQLGLSHNFSEFMGVNAFGLAGGSLVFASSDELNASLGWGSFQDGISADFFVSKKIGSKITVTSNAYIDMSWSSSSVEYGAGSSFGLPFNKTTSVNVDYQFRNKQEKSGTNIFNNNTFKVTLGKWW
jgi:hypothetical protein